MIPDKIFLVRDAANPEGIFDTVASRKPMFQDDIPYIRKEALVEWARKSKLNTEHTNGIGWDDCLDELINHIESL